MALEAPFAQLAAMPAPEANAATWSWLTRLGSRLGNVVRAAVRDKRLASFSYANWPEGQQAIRRTFGLHDHHFFGVSGHEWLSLTETQTTGGLAHFIDVTDVEHRRACVAALFAASGAPIAAGEQIVDARVVPEYPIKHGRLDLLALIRTASGGAHLLVIEGKFEYDLSHNQLRRYERALPGVIAAEELGSPSLTLLVVGNRLRRRTRKQLDRHKQWRFISWSDLMLKLEKRLPAFADNDDFRRFRRTLWDRYV